MEPCTVIWRSGDRWRDLNAEVTDISFTAISRSGATRIVKRAGNGAPGLWHIRLPFEGGHRMLADGRRTRDGLTGWGRLDQFHLTPCGLTVVEPGSRITDDGGVRGYGYWEKSTQLRLVLAGVVPDWPSTSPGRHTVEQIVNKATIDDYTGHPDEPCGALYCLRRSEFVAP